MLGQSPLKSERQIKIFLAGNQFYRVSQKIFYFSKKSGSYYKGTIGPEKMSFSQIDVLMSTPSSEKDSPIGQMVPWQMPSQYFEK